MNQLVTVDEVQQETRLVSADVEEARSLGGRIYYPHTTKVVGEERDFKMRVETVRLGPVTLGWLSYDTEVIIRTGELEDGYQINVPVRGSLRTSAGEQRMVADRHHGAVYGPQHSTLMHGWGVPCQMLAVKIERQALEETLSAQLGRAIGGPISFALPLDLSVGPGRRWWSLISLLLEDVRDSHGLSASRISSAPLAQSVIAGLLASADHNFSSELAEPHAPHPRAVGDAIAFIEQHSTESLPVAAIADAVGVCVRVLQQSFHDSVGKSPTQFSRELRMQKAHDALRRADCRQTTVATVANAHGFSHLGHFTTQYRSAYGTTPATTLRGAN